MHIELTQYLDGVALPQGRLRTELYAQVKDRYDERTSKGAEEEYAAEQLISAMGDAGKLSRDLKYDQYRFSGLPMMLVACALFLATFVASLVTGAIAGFSPLLFIGLVALSLGLAALGSLHGGFSVGKLLTGSQGIGIGLGILLFMVPTAIRFWNANLVDLGMFFDKHTQVLADGSTYVQVTDYVIMCGLYLLLNFLAMTAAKLVIAWRTKEHNAVTSVLHIRFADFMG